MSCLTGMMAGYNRLYNFRNSQEWEDKGETALHANRPLLDHFEGHVSDTGHKGLQNVIFFKSRSLDLILGNLHFDNIPLYFKSYPLITLVCMN